MTVFLLILFETISIISLLSMSLFIGFDNIINNYCKYDMDDRAVFLFIIGVFLGWNPIVTAFFIGLLIYGFKKIK